MTSTPNPREYPAPPSAVGRLLRDAGRALSLNQAEAAERALDRALALAPGHAETHRLMGIAALMTGQHAKAIDSLHRALAQRPNDATINMTLGNALAEAGATEDSLVYLKRACELAPENAVMWCNFGVVLASDENMEQARIAFEHAVTMDPDFIKARNKLADVLISLGETSAAVSTLRGTLGRKPDCAEAWLALSNLKTEPLSREDVRLLQSLLHRSGIPDDARIALSFTLAKALDDQSDYAAAFDILSKANALQRGHLYWSRSEERARVEAIAQVFARPMPEPLDATLGEEVIFVVCLPRSGSTLTEQILASHPQVHGGDELTVLPDILDEESDRRGKPFPQWVPAATSADWRRLGEDYLERTRKFRDEHLRFTDKALENWAFAGAALAMLPGARIVNSRRDPLETCFACYRQLFRTGAHFSYDLDDMVDYYAGYERLSTLWLHKFPQRYFDNHYESLQRDLEEQVRRLLDFCKLPFDAACLAFHQTRRTILTLSSAQVREPLRQDTARSERYGAKLDPLRARLRAAGLNRR